MCMHNTYKNSIIQPYTHKLLCAMKYIDFIE